MTVTPNPEEEKQQRPIAGQASMASIAQTLGFASQQSDAMTEAWAVASKRSAALQLEWLARQTELWKSMLNAPATEKPATEIVGLEPGDKRFADSAWSTSPIYDYLRRTYLLNSHYLKKIAEELPIEVGPVRDRFDFLLRQYVDAMSPANFAATNPEFVQKALETKGESIQRAIQNLIRDVDQGAITVTDTSAFVVGKDLATTPGKIVFENELLQLIQYAPLTETVAERPLLMVPPCINKFYILDLQQHNSFVRHAVEQGNTVFMISWRNPREAQGHLTWSDYIEQGVLAAIDVVRNITSIDTINALGFCVGGTMLSTALAVASARGEAPAHSLTLLTTLLDFSSAGDLACFVDEAMITRQEVAIGKQGIFPGKEMAVVFSSLRANDLIWQYVVGNYLKGNSPSAFDLLYWNADSTNLPGPFLVWYLKNLYLANNLCVPGKLHVGETPIDLGNIDIPAFVFATREDHIVPWESAFKSTQLLAGETTFVLGASGHVAGVINPARANKRSYWTGTSDSAVAAEWFAKADEAKGSWWAQWSQWLQLRGGKSIPARKKLGNRKFSPQADAPGSYVLEKAG